MGERTGEAFGARLRRLREARGLSQDQLAERAGLSGNAVGALERGDRRRPYPQTLRALADALALEGAARDALLAAARDPAQPPQPPQPPARGSAAGAVPPRPPTSLIGREADLGALAARLGTGEGRLLTLTGPGGVGKTRLALALADAAAGQFPDGVAFVSLAPFADPALVIPAIAGALGVRESGGRPLAEDLGAALRARCPLLILDNCEHLLPDAAPAIGALLAAAPALTLLATSRAPLRLRGEVEYPVAPLTLPALDRVPTAAEVAVSPAARLFVERAVATAPDFALGATNAAAVAAICRRLDGLPLALELAAAWVKVLTPTALLARLDAALPLLAGGARDLPARQRTLRDTVAWSYDLLEAGERVLFRRLAPLAGSWTIRTAASVAIDEVDAAGQPEEFVALAGVAALLEKSLIVRLPGPADDPYPRFTMLETIRAYALERLAASGEEAAVRDRHAARYLGLAERAEPELFRAEQRYWLDRIARDTDNLRAAHGWLLERGDAGGAARLGAALGQYWVVRGPLAEGRLWLERALGFGAALDARTEARARLALVALAITQARFAFVAEQAAAALALARTANDTQAAAAALAMLGYTTVALDADAAASAARFAEALALYRAAGDEGAVGRTLFGMGNAALRLGDLPRASALLAEAEAALRAHGSWWVLTGCLLTRARLALVAGEGALSTALCREALALAQRIGDAVALPPHCLVGLASALAQTAQAARSARLFGAAEALFERNGSSIEIGPGRAAHERQVARARADLSPDDFAAAWAAGRALSLEAAIAEALGAHP